MTHGTIGRQTTAIVDSGDLKYSRACSLPIANVVATIPYVNEAQYSVVAAIPASTSGEKYVIVLSMPSYMNSMGFDVGYCIR